MAAAQVYFDSSVLVALFTDDACHDKAKDFIRSTGPIAVVSDLAMAEFSSAVARLYRMDVLTAADTTAVFANFDAWTARVTRRVSIDSADVLAGNMMVRRLDLGLRAPDAIHLAIAQRLDLVVATFDEKMAAAAASLRMELAKV